MEAKYIVIFATESVF